MRAIAIGLIAAFGLLAPAAEAAKPKRATVLRAITKVQKQTPFKAGKRSAAKARRAFARGKACRAANALAAHHRHAAKRRLRALGARSVRARMLVLRSRPKRKGCGGKPTVAVDTKLKPGARLPDGTPVASVVDAGGNQVDFAANQLIVQGDRADVDALLRRHDGSIVSEAEGFFVIRIKPDRAKPRRLAADLAALGGKSRGAASTVSSQQGLDLIATASREARTADDLKVGMNYVTSGYAIAAGSAIEDPRGPGGFATSGGGWDPDPFRWKHLTQTGVPAAWQLLARSGRTQNKVGLAVLDMGFATQVNQPDFGSPLNAISNVPFADALNNPNKLDCGGSSCPWHGTNVANTAFSEVDDNNGVAGTGGPVANRIVVYTLYDFGTSITALSSAYGAGAKVINMSYGAAVPYYLAWSVLPFEVATLLKRAQGVTLIASAGNSNIDVDAEDCFLKCWEEAWVTPCENGGVICVGALEKDGNKRASYSNYGGQVDIFAPGTVLVGYDPATSLNNGKTPVHSVSGTSFAAPYLAGVVALMRAANPGASRGTIEDVLKSTATASPDPQVKKYVNAAAAVRRLLPRLVNIEAPREGDQYSKGTLLTLSAFGFDPGGASPTITWTRNGAPIGTGATIQADLPYGPAEIRAAATFPGGGFAVDTRRITITNTPPTLAIKQPADGATFFQGEKVALKSDSGDINQPGGRLRPEEITWTRSGLAFGTGEDPTLDLTDVPVGAHTVTARATDEAGATVTDSITINVAEPPPNLPPSVTITSPADDTALDFEPGEDYGIADFQADVSDPEGDALTYTWTEQLLPGGAITTRSTVEDPGPQQVHFSGCSGEGTRWTLTVSDGTHTRSDAVTLRFNVVC